MPDKNDEGKYFFLKRSTLSKIFTLFLISHLLAFIIGFKSHCLHSRSIPAPCCEVVFSYPKSNRPLGFQPMMQRLIELIKDAKKSIYLKAYGFTNVELTKALMSAAERGVEVRLLIDHAYEDHLYKKLNFIYHNNLQNISIDIINIKGGIGHDKFVIIDNKIVWNGSFNFTYHADSHNEENAFILFTNDSSQEIVEKYMDHWHRSARFHKTKSLKTGKWKAPQNSRLWEQEIEVAPIPKKDKTIADLCEQAKSSMVIIAHSSLSDEEVNVLLMAKERGINVEMICSETSYNETINKIGRHVLIKQDRRVTEDIFIIDNEDAFEKKAGQIKKITKKNLAKIIKAYIKN